MTSLVQDTTCSNKPVFVTYFARINPEVLQEIIMRNDLNEREIISIIFLMVDTNTDFSKVIQEIRDDHKSAFTRLTSKTAWSGKLLESLILIGNKEVIQRMRFSQQEIQHMENSFLTNRHNIISYLNKAIISLYFLCENLVDDEFIELVTFVNNKLCKPVDINDKQLNLELYILEWLKQGYISIDPDNLNLSDLINLKSSDCSLDLPFHVNDWEKHKPFGNKNKPDSQKYPIVLNKQCDSENTNSESEYSLLINNKHVMWSTADHKKLCIIINQINFSHTDKEEEGMTRIGSEVDEKSLEETFMGCGFEVQKHRDWKKQNMVDLLDSFVATNHGDKKYATYGAIFICILSHGLEDAVIFSDCETLSFAEIRDKFCCKKLKNVLKFVILQSCQGQQQGMINIDEKYIYSMNNTNEDRQASIFVDNILVSDGPINPNPLHRGHFALFLATTRDFAAMRDEKKGTLFIQNLCRVIKSANKFIKMTELIEKVIHEVRSIRSPVSGNKLQRIVQQPELLYNTMSVPYILIPKFSKIFR